MKLYGSETSPYVRKVRVLVEEKSIPCEFVVEDPWQTSPRLLAINPIGKVPVLELDDGTTLFDSLLVMEFLDRINNPAGDMLPAAGEVRWQVLRWHALAHGIIDACVVQVLESRRPEDKRMADRAARELARIGRILDGAAAEVPGPGALVGGRLTLADLMFGVALQYIDFRIPHDWRSTRPRLAAWLADVAVRPAFTRTLPPGFTRTT